MRLLRRVQYMLTIGRRQQELADELEFHRAERQRELERHGMTPEAASVASRRALGNVTLAREDARRIWMAAWIEGLWQDARYSICVMRRNPGFALSMALVLSLGIGATTGVFTLIDGLVLRGLPVKDPERLVYFTRPSFSYPVLTELQARGSDIFSNLSAWNLEQQNVQWNTELEPAEVLEASGNLYSTLGIQAAVGRLFSAEDDAIGGGRFGMVAVISHSAWQTRFRGSPDVVGRTVRIERQPFTIIGVTPRGFFGVAPGLAPEITIPLTTLHDQGHLQSRTNSWVHLLGRLRDGVTIQQANAALQAVWPAVLEVTTNAGMPADGRARYLSRTTSLESARAGFSRVRNQFEEPLWVLLALVGLLLAVAMASAANLLLARGVARHREFAVRLAIGAGRWRLVRQVLTETLVWTVLSGAIGLLLASWASGVLVSMMSTWESPIALETAPTWRVVSFTIGLAFATAGIFAIVPALRSTRVHGGSALKEAAEVEGAGSRRWSLVKTLVVAQVALTVLLLFGASLFVRSLNRILAQDAGFERDRTLIIFTDASAAGYNDARHTGFYTELLQRLANIPGVESASLSQYPPISDQDGAWTQSIGIDGAPVETLDKAREVYFNGVTPGYFGTLGIRLLQGRDFAAGDRAGSRPVVIVNDTLARTFFPGRNPIGRTITIGRNASRRELEIVGVVTALKYQHLMEPSRNVAFLPRDQLAETLEGENLVAEVRATGPMAAVADRVWREVRALDGAVPIRIQTIEDRIRASLVKERVIAALATTLGLTALLLACAGLYGLLAYTVSRRTREIGLRLALGAERRRMLWMVLRQSLLLALAGIAAGLAASFAFGELARNLLFQVSETDALAIAAAGLLMLVVALLAGFLPARRAARVDPMTALRSL